MSDLRLESIPYEFDGRVYRLRCNMNVLADVQEWNNGKISPALQGKSAQKSALQFLAAMMNDYADERGWFDADPDTGVPILVKPFTPRGLGRVLTLQELPTSDILGLVFRALTTRRSGEPAGSDEPGDSGN